MAFMKLRLTIIQAPVQNKRMTAQLQGPPNNDPDSRLCHSPQKLCHQKRLFFQHHAAPFKDSYRPTHRTYYWRTLFLPGLREKPKPAYFHFLLFPTAIKENRKITILILGWLITISSSFLSSNLYRTILSTKMKCLYTKALPVISQ